MSEEEPKPLDYKTPDRPPATVGTIGSSVAGFLLGLVAMVGMTFAVAVTASRSNPGKEAIAACCVGVAIVAVIGTVWAMGVGGRRRYMFLAGFLIGVAVMALLEGACFHSTIG